MHPPLFRPHPDCSHLVDLLVKCHEEKPMGKFFGACNDFKYQMDKCFKQEKDKKRIENLQKARDIEARFEQRLANLEKEIK